MWSDGIFANLSWALAPGNATFPPLATNDSATIEYSVPLRTQQISEANAYRPDTLLVINDLPPYVLGLFYVPFILLSAFVLFFLLVIVFALMRERGKLQTCCRSRVVNQVVLGAFLFIAVAAFAASVGMSAMIFTNSQAISNDLDQFSAVFSNVSAQSNVFSAVALEMQNRLDDLNCFLPGVALGIQTLFEPKLNQLTGSSNTMKSTLNSAWSAYNSTKDTANDVLYIQSVISVSLSSALCAISLLVLIYLWVKLRKDTEDSVRVHRHRRCSWSVGCFCSLLAITLVLILCSIAHIVPLLITDVCYPQVNDNINALVAESESLTLASKEDTCAQIRAMPNAPDILLALCYIQTCDGFDSIFPQFEESAVDLDQMLVLIQQLPLGICQNTADVDELIWNVISAAAWTQFYLSCPQVNPLYANMVYESVCNNHVVWSIAMFALWTLGWICLMLSLLHWMFLMGDYETSNPVFKKPATASIDTDVSTFGGPADAATRSRMSIPTTDNSNYQATKF